MSTVTTQDSAAAARERQGGKSEAEILDELEVWLWQKQQHCLAMGAAVRCAASPYGLLAGTTPPDAAYWSEEWRQYFRLSNRVKQLREQVG